jgi:ribonuclease T2
MKLLLALTLLLSVTSPLALARHSSSRGQEARAGQFDYYLLTLSWSPTYCLTHGDDRSQCSGKGYGFVLHGLWPQYDAGGYPERCAANRQLSRDAEARGQTVFVSPTLMRHEWEAHGTCSGLDAKRYFETADRALASVHVPDAFAAPRRLRSLTATQIVEQFRKANPALPADGLVVSCGRGELTEVRLCLTRDLQPRECGRGVRTSCPSSAVDIPARR